MRTNLDALQRAIDLLPRPRKSSAARAMGVTPQFVSALLAGASELPPKRCVRLSLAVNGAVTCHELRPDIFPSEFEQQQAV